jgi:hypothetical protein
VSNTDTTAEVLKLGLPDNVIDGVVIDKDGEPVREVYSVVLSMPSEIVSYFETIEDTAWIVEVDAETGCSVLEIEAYGQTDLEDQIDTLTFSLACLPGIHEKQEDSVGQATLLGEDEVQKVPDREPGQRLPSLDARLQIAKRLYDSGDAPNYQSMLYALGDLITFAEERLAINVELLNEVFTLNKAVK